MNVLGISAHYHDSAAALVSQRRVVAAAAEERFTRQKHDPNFPKFAIDFCLNEAGLAAQELDEIIFYEEPHIKFTRVLASTLAPYPLSRSAFVRAMKAWLGEKLWTKNEISKRLDVHPNKITFIPHHLSHAAQAFFGSSFSDAAILTVDAVGEWSSTSLYHARHNGGVEIKQLQDIPYPHSLGLVYSVFTAFLGFRPNDGECSTMALAAFGKPVYADAIRKIIRTQSDGTYTIDQSFFNFNRFSNIPYSSKFIETFGQPRNFRDVLPFNTLSDSTDGRAEVSKEHQRFADIAASIQVVLEDTLLLLVRKLHRLTGAKNLCMAGGVALNCVANSRILRESPFENLFIPPDPGDGGTALGAALYASFSKGSVSAADLNFALTPFMGKQYDESRDVNMLKQVDPDCWLPYRKRGASQMPGMKLDINVHNDFDAIVPGVVDDLMNGKVVAWVQGRFENGPRALGNRSLLIDPANRRTAMRLSETVKSRAPFRPYAFSITEEDAGKVLDIEGALPHTTKWMQSVEKVKTDALPTVSAALHIDGTTRTQVCAVDDNPRYHKLLSAFGEATGTAALLNTSFNESGYPIVSSPSEALLAFARTDIDTIVINNMVARKTGQ